MFIDVRIYLFGFVTDKNQEYFAKVTCKHRVKFLFTIQKREQLFKEFVFTK